VECFIDSEDQRNPAQHVEGERADLFLKKRSTQRDASGSVR